MTVRAPSLAKLTRPKLYDALPRPRLFTLLDRAVTRPIVWLCASPGSGKTTLVASYLQARDLRHLWYQADSGDADPATFVHYMRMAAAQAAGRRASRLPFYAPEPEQKLPRFARTFFRDFCSILPRPCVVVFDNFHEIRVRQREGRIAFAEALDEIPDGITVFFVTRSDPPPEFARLFASGKVARIEEAELRCTPEESEAILGRQRMDAQELRRITEQSEGWMAALALLRERLSHGRSTLDQSLGESKDAIFNYFAGEIFNHARPDNQRVLMLTALPTSITATEAIALSGSEEAPRLLEYLYRRRLFIDRRRGEETTYHYHGLFREFLLEQSRQRIAEDEHRRVHVVAAQLLARRGQIGEALSLFRRAGKWEEMRSLLHEHALEWARQGRAQMLSDWIEALPQTIRRNDPWLEYWFGRAWIFVEPKRGRPSLERAFDAFRIAGDARGQALALNTIVTGYSYEWASFAPLDRWLPEFDRLLDSRGPALDAASELRARSAWVIALLMRNPEDHRLAPCARRLDELLDGEEDVNVRLMAASVLFQYINWKTEGEHAADLVARIEPVLARPEVTPLMHVQWRTHLSFWHYINGRYERSTAAMQEARAIAERYGLEAYLFEIDHADASALINDGQHDRATACLETMERRLSPTRRMQWPFFHHLRSTLAQRLGRAAAALHEAERAVALARELGIPSLQMPHFLARLAQARNAAGDQRGALATIEEAIALASPFERTTFEQRRDLLQIEIAFESGDAEHTAERLARVLAQCRAGDRYIFMRSRPDLAARLLDLALERGIETDFVLALIRHNGLVAPPHASAAWPFRLRIRVLGGFELARDNVPMRFTGKAQQRPLDLLKLLAALGGRDIDAHHVTAALWPEADGASAKNSFDMALFRLRKLLDVDDAIVLSSGKVSFAPELVWTDMAALEAVLESTRSDPDPVRAARRLLAAYRGPLLGVDQQPWIAKPRDALRARFVRALIRLGEQLEGQGDLPAAIEVYQSGLEADNLAEGFYRGLMRVLAATGHRADAMSAFRRCRELLSIVLGVKPSADTERLYREIAGHV